MKDLPIELAERISSSAAQGRGAVLLENDVAELLAYLTALRERCERAEVDGKKQDAMLAVKLADALLNEYPRIVYGLRIPGDVPENAAAERAYHQGNFARFLLTQLGAARAERAEEGNKQ